MTDYITASEILADANTLVQNTKSRFSVDIYQEGVKGRIIRHKDLQNIIKELKKAYPHLDKLFDFKGRRRQIGQWDNVNYDIAQFSKNYPLAMFEISRYEPAFIRKGDVVRTTNLLTKINVLNGSINVFTLAEKPLEEKEQKNEQVTSRDSETE